MDLVIGRTCRITRGVKVYGSRWFVLILYCLVAIMNFMQVLEFTMVASLTEKYYEEDYFSAEATYWIFGLVYIIMWLPVSYLIERFNMRATMIIAALLTTSGIAVKVGNYGKFSMLMIAQTLCAVGQVYILSTPSKIASSWFGPNEVSTACALAVLGTKLGLTVGAIVPVFFIRTEDDLTYNGGQFHLHVYNIIASFAVFGLVAKLSKKKPKLPPSKSQLRLRQIVNSSYFDYLKQLLSNTNFLMLLLSFGLFNGILNSFGFISKDAFVHLFHDRESDIGKIIVATIASGGIGCVVIGFILDETHQYKSTSIVVMLLSSGLYLAVLYSLTIQSLVGIYFAIPAWGFFAASGLVISFEYTLEETYPIPESISCSVMNATIYLFSFIEYLVAKQLVGKVDYLNIALCGLGVYLVSTVLMIFAKKNLRRREANLG